MALSINALLFVKPSIAIAASLFWTASLESHTLYLCFLYSSLILFSSRKLWHCAGTSTCAKSPFSKGILAFLVFIATNQCRLPLTSACKKSPHCGDLRDSAGSSAPAFYLQTFFASVKVPFGRYWFPIPSFSLRPKSGQICFKQSYPATYSTCFAKRHTRANRAQKRRIFLARLFLRIFILCFVSGKVTSGRYLLQTPPFFLCPKSGQIRSKLPYPATVPPVPQSGTQGQTGCKKANPLARLSTLFSVLWTSMLFWWKLLPIR